MTVEELINHLEGFPKDLQVVFQCHSEYLLLEARDIGIAELCEPRPDGWVHDKRPDKETQDYVVFPGN